MMAIVYLLLTAFYLWWLARLVRDWIRDIIFYRDRRWNFDISSGRNINYAHNQVGIGKPFRNRTRVVFAYPLIIVIVLLLLVAFAFATLMQAGLVKELIF